MLQCSAVCQLKWLGHENRSQDANMNVDHWVLNNAYIDMRHVVVVISGQLFFRQYVLYNVTYCFPGVYQCSDIEQSTLFPASKFSFMFYVSTKKKLRYRYELEGLQVWRQRSWKSLMQISNLASESSSKYRIGQILFFELELCALYDLDALWLQPNFLCEIYLYLVVNKQLCAIIQSEEFDKFSFVSKIRFSRVLYKNPVSKSLPCINRTNVKMSNVCICIKSATFVLYCCLKKCISKEWLIITKFKITAIAKSFSIILLL
jgi:hypothetical protein